MSRALWTAAIGALVFDQACGGITSVEVDVTDAGASAEAGGASAASVTPAHGGGAIRRPPGSGYCGDGIRNADEQCDRLDFGGETCGTVMMSTTIGGALRCTTRCTLDLGECRSRSATGVPSNMGYGGTMVGTGGHS